MKRLAMAATVAMAATALPLTASAADFGVRVVIGGGDGVLVGDWRGARSAFRYGYDRGWREGTEEGHRDGSRLRDRRFWRDDDFRDADAGYRFWMGRRDDYVRGFRDGYATGYRRAYAAARPGWGDRDWERDRRDRRDWDRRDWDRDRRDGDRRDWDGDRRWDR